MLWVGIVALLAGAACIWVAVRTQRRVHAMMAAETLSVPELLDLAGVDRAQIVADYTLTATYLGPLIDQHRAAVEAEGGDFATYAKYLASTPATMEAFLDHFAAHHGGTEAFLTRHGLTSDEIAVLRARLAPVTAQQGAA